MHVVHVETGQNLYGGAQQVLYITTGLQQRGIGTTLICPPDTLLAARAAEAGVRVVGMACRGDLDFACLWRLRREFAGLCPDLVHCHSRRGADIYGGRAAAGLGIPAVVSRRVDNTEPAFLARFRYRPFVSVIAISDAIAGVLRATGMDARKLQTIRSAVDGSAFVDKPPRKELTRRFGIDDRHLALVAAGQLIERKGQRYLLDAVAALRETFPALRLVLFGQGRDEATLRARSRELGIDDIVHFAGFDDELDSYLGAFDLLVHPALAEGLGVIALKAQAAGLPVVAFDAGGLGEVVRDGETGRLVPPRDVGALSAALASLLDDIALRERYATAAREHAATHFSVAKMVEAHIRLYSSLLND